MKKIILYSQIFLTILMVQDVHASLLDAKAISLDEDAAQRGRLTETKVDAVQPLTEIQGSFWYPRASVFVPTMEQFYGLIDHGLMTRREVRSWIAKMEPKTSAEKEIVNTLNSRYNPLTDTVALAKKRAERRTEIADKKIKIAREKKDSADSARANYAQIIQNKKAQRIARKSGIQIE